MKMNAVQIEDAMKSYEQGSNLTVIAKHYGVSVPTLSRYLRNNGITLRGRGAGKKKESVAATQFVTTGDFTEINEHDSAARARNAAGFANASEI